MHTCPLLFFPQQATCRVSRRAQLCSLNQNISFKINIIMSLLKMNHIKKGQKKHRLIASHPSHDQRRLPILGEDQARIGAQKNCHYLPANINTRVSRTSVLCFSQINATQPFECNHWEHNLTVHIGAPAPNNSFYLECACVFTL